jgi:hypothetical protein
MAKEQFWDKKMCAVCINAYPQLTQPIFSGLSTSVVLKEIEEIGYSGLTDDVVKAIQSHFNQPMSRSATVKEVFRLLFKSCYIWIVVMVNTAPFLWINP